MLLIFSALHTFNGDKTHKPASLFEVATTILACHQLSIRAGLKIGTECVNSQRESVPVWKNQSIKKGGE